MKTTLREEPRSVWYHLYFTNPPEFDQMVKVIADNNIAFLRNEIDVRLAKIYTYVQDDFVFELYFDKNEYNNKRFDDALFMGTPNETVEGFSKQEIKEKLWKIGSEIVNALNEVED